MIEIKDLLLNLNNKLLLEGLKKDIICNILSEALNLKINSNDVEVKNNIIYLKIKPIYKNEILLKKDFINKKLVESLGEKFKKDFR